MQGQGICTSLLGPRQKKKVSAVDGSTILVIHVMPGGLVGQGAEFSRSSCVLMELTARQPKRVSISTLSLHREKKKKKTHPPLPYPPSAYLACRPDLLKLTLHQKYPLCLALLHTSRLCKEASSTSNCRRILFHLLHIPTEGAGGGGGVGALPFWLCGYTMTEQHTCKRCSGAAPRRASSHDAWIQERFCCTGPPRDLSIPVFKSFPNSNLEP